MTTPYDPYQAATNQLPGATQNQIPGQVVGINNATINTSEMNISSIGGGVIYGYSGNPGPGNLYFSVAPQGGTDNFGNSFPSGISAISGQMQGTSLIGVTMDATSTLTGTNISQPQVLNPTMNGGTAQSLVHTMINTNGSVLGYTYGNSTATFTTAGTYQWSLPTNFTQPTNIRVQCWAGGAGGGGGGPSQGGESGGGGEYAEEPSFQALPGVVYTVQVGAGGAGGATGFSGGNGQASQFYGPGSLTVVANPGLAGSNYVHGSGGSGSNNTIHFNGGDGIDGSGFTGGSSGGGAGGPGGPGGQGVQSTGTSGGTPGGATGSGNTPPNGNGGIGGNSGSSGAGGSAPGGAGGGAGSNATVSNRNVYQPNGGTYSYYGADAGGVTKNGLRNHDGVLYQGDWQAPASGSLGHQYSYFTLPFSTIQSDMKGKTITNVVIHIRCLHAYYNAGMYANARYSSLSSFGSIGNSTSGSPTDVLNFAIAINETANPNCGTNGGIGLALQNGGAKSILFGPTNNSQGLAYYGYFDSGANGGVIPEIFIDNSSGGSSTAGAGATGQVILTYGSGASPVYQLSVSATQANDIFGNPVQPGFQGPQVTVTGNSTVPATGSSTGSTVASSAIVQASTNGTIVATNSAGFVGAMPTNQVDIGRYTAFTNVQQQITKSWVIPAGDAEVGTCYRMTAIGGGVTSSVGNNMSLNINVNGSQICVINVSGGWLPNGIDFEMNLVGYVAVVASGSSGTYHTNLRADLSRFNGILNPGVNTVNTGGFVASIQNNVWNTTGPNTINMGAIFGGNSGTAQCFTLFNMLERLGP